MGIMKHNPDNLAKTSIYLASKIEDNVVDNLENFCCKVRENSELVRLCETKLLDGTSYDLMIYSPFRSLRRLLVIIKKNLMISEQKTNQRNNHILTRLNMGACRLIEEQMLTDLPLEYTPGHLATAALLLAFEGKYLPISTFPTLYNQEYQNLDEGILSSVACITRKLRS